MSLCSPPWTEIHDVDPSALVLRDLPVSVSGVLRQNPFIPGILFTFLKCTKFALDRKTHEGLNKHLHFEVLCHILTVGFLSCTFLVSLQNLTGLAVAMIYLRN